MNDPEQPAPGAPDPADRPSPISGTPPPAAGQFKKGHSGNPGGRPKGLNLTAILRRRVEEQRGDKTVGEIVVEALLKGALQGRHQHLKEVWDRLDGPIKQQLQAELQSAAPSTAAMLQIMVQAVPPEQRRAVIDAVRARLGDIADGAEPV